MSHADSAGHAAFADWDAAYVLGALDSSERHEYEEHLAHCGECRAAVTELAAMPALLTRARPWLDDSGEASGPPHNLVELVEARAARQRRGTRRRVAWIAAGAAAVLAFGVGVPVALSTAEGEPAAVVALAPVADSPLIASVSLESTAWGTAVAMTCEYPENGAPYASAAVYALQITSADGTVEPVATWSAAPGQTVHLNAATATAADHIASVQIVDASGAVLLESAA